MIRDHEMKQYQCPDCLLPYTTQVNLDCHYTTNPYCFVLRKLRQQSADISECSALICMYCDDKSEFACHSALLTHTRRCVPYLEFKVEEKEVELRAVRLEHAKEMCEQQNKYELLLQKQESEMTTLRNEYHAKTLELMNRIEQLLISSAYGKTHSASITSSSFSTVNSVSMHTNPSIPLQHQMRLNELNLQPLDMEYVKTVVSSYTYEDLYIKGPEHYIVTCLRKDNKYMVKKISSRNVFVYYDLDKSEFVNDNSLTILLPKLTLLINQQLDAEQKAYFDSLCAKGVFNVTTDQKAKVLYFSREEVEERDKQEFRRFREFLKKKKASLWKDVLKIVKPYFS